jgi:phenylpyruvate tautomerase PptA (4-oxalocrotonate tautomerase family)
MIHAALRAGREVTFIEDDDLISVGGIKEVDPEDWIAGWQLVTKE